MSTSNKIKTSLATLIVISFTVFLQFLPLTNTTGYEFSFLTSFLLFFIGGMLSVSTFNKREKVLFALFFNVVPFLISIVGNILFSTCPISNDAFFYLVLSVPSFMNGYLIGLIISNSVKRFRFLVFIFTSIGILLISLVEFYFRPQIYFYNIVYGYFPGTMYDENISITIKLIAYRILSFGFIYFIYLMSLSKSKFKKYSLLWIPTIIFLWFMVLKPVFGFGTSNNDIQSELTQELVTEHFKIYTDKNIEFDPTSIEEMHEFYYAEIKEKLTLSEDRVITSYIFKDNVQKKRLFGSENADVAKPWLKQIYLDENTFQRSLKHEIVHILAGEFGNAPFDVAANINPALIEGLAMAIENNFDDMDIDYIVALAIKNGNSLKLENLFSGYNFLGNLSSQSYLFSGSFIKYLINTHGIEKVKELYSNGDFQLTYGTSIKKFEEDFLTYINELGFTSNAEIVQLYFGRPALIQKVCPRLAARIERSGWDLYRSEKYDAALEKFNFVYNSVGSYSSLNGILLTNTRLNKNKYALLLAEEKLPSFSNTSYFYNLILRIADLEVLCGDSTRAIERIIQLEKLNPSIQYYAESKIRNLLISNGIDVYIKYLYANSEERFNILLNSCETLNLNPSIVLKLVELIPYVQGEKNKFTEIMDSVDLGLSRESVFAAYKLSQYFYRLNDLKRASAFSKYAIDKNRRLEFQEILDEQNKLINWSINKLK